MYLACNRRVRNRCAHGGVLFDYAASEALTTKGPVNLSSVPDRTNLRGAIEVIKYLTGIVSVNRLADLEQELQQLIDRCKDNDALYTLPRPSPNKSPLPVVQEYRNGTEANA